MPANKATAQPNCADSRGKQAAPSGPGATLKPIRWRGPSTNRAMWSVGQ
jgi:hypothetical protein